MGMDRSSMENIDFTGDAVYYNAIDPITGEISDKKTKIDFDTILKVSKIFNIPCEIVTR